MSKKLLLFIPAYCCEKQISRVLGKFTTEDAAYFTEILVIDNQSPDNTANVAIEAATELTNRTNTHIKVLRNIENVSLGGTHKVAFNYAIDHHFDYVCILHGDDQGSIQDLVAALQEAKHPNLDFYLGARFLPDSTLVGYSAWRIFGNHVFNTLFSLVTRKRLWDLGSGMNIFSVDALKSRFYLNFPNRLTFNYYLTLYMCAHRLNIDYFPHQWSEDDQVSNLKLFKAVREIIALLIKYIWAGKKLFSALPKDQHSYQTEVLYDNKT